MSSSGTGVPDCWDTCANVEGNETGRYVGAPTVLALDEPQLRLLKGVASGTAVVDLADELGYSRSSLYRELSKLWKALGVDERAQAVRKAAAEGLLE